MFVSHVGHGSWVTKNHPVPSLDRKRLAADGLKDGTTRRLIAIELKPSAELIYEAPNETINVSRYASNLSRCFLCPLLVHVVWRSVNHRAFDVSNCRSTHFCWIAHAARLPVGNQRTFDLWRNSPGAVTDLEGAEPASLPPPLGDGLTPSLTVLVICDKGRGLYCIMATPSPV